jgi:hypothetical protein
MNSQQLSILKRQANDEALFLSGKRDRTEELASAIRVFQEFVNGLDSLQVLERPCVTVFASARCPGRKMSSAQGSVGQLTYSQKGIHVERWIFERMWTFGLDKHFDIAP